MADTRTPVAAPRQQFINIDLVRRIVLCRNLSGTSRSVLLTVGMHASKERRQCFCSVDTLARESGWSRRTVTEHLTRLQQLGYLSLIGHHHSGTCIYQVRLEQLPADVASHQSHDGTDTAHAAHPASTAATAYSPAAPAPAVPSPSPAPAPHQPHHPARHLHTPQAPAARPPCRSCLPPTRQLHTKKGWNKGLNYKGRKKARTQRCQQQARPAPQPLQPSAFPLWLPSKIWPRHRCCRR